MRYEISGHLDVRTIRRWLRDQAGIVLLSRAGLDEKVLDVPSALTIEEMRKELCRQLGIYIPPNPKEWRVIEPVDGQLHLILPSYFAGIMQGAKVVGGKAVVDVPATQIGNVLETLDATYGRRKVFKITVVVCDESKLARIGIASAGGKTSAAGASIIPVGADAFVDAAIQAGALMRRLEYRCVDGGQLSVSDSITQNVQQFTEAQQTGGNGRLATSLTPVTAGFLINGTVSAVGELLRIEGSLEVSSFSTGLDKTERKVPLQMDIYRGECLRVLALTTKQVGGAADLSAKAASVNGSKENFVVFLAVE